MFKSDTTSDEYQLTFDYRSEYLIAKVSGVKDSVEVTCDYWKRVGEELRSTGYKKVLVLEMLRDTITVDEGVRCVRARDTDSFSGVKIAFIDIRADHNKVNAFVHGACILAGFHTRVFTNLRDAKEWLTK